MIGTLVIVFREVLEAALVISIVLAATRGVAGRGWWVGGGVLAGLLGSAVVAGFAQAIADAAAGMGQEVFNASVLFAAVSIAAWRAEARDQRPYYWLFERQSVIDKRRNPDFYIYIHIYSNS